jgi:tetratricopeptide (TPR) repeat protein
MHTLGLKGKRLLAVLGWIEARLREIDKPLEEVRFVRRGKRLFVRLPGQEIELWSGQIQLGFDRAAPAVETRPAEERKRQQRNESDIWFQRGLALEQENAPMNEVIAAYLKAVELDEKSAGAFVNLGTLYFNARMWREAEHYYTRALEADPAYPLAHFNLANLYDERGDRTSAARHYEEALRLKPGYADAHYNLALLCQSQGQVMKALKHWRIYLKLDPASAWAGIARREMRKLQESSVIGGKSPGRSRGVSAS